MRPEFEFMQQLGGKRGLLARVTSPGLNKVVFPRAPLIPDAGEDQHHGARAGEQNQKRRRQHEPGDDCGRRGKSSTDVAVKSAGPRALRAALENHLQGLVRACERGRAIARTNHAGRGWRLDAVVAQCPSAIRTDRDRFSVVLGAFHSLRYVVGSARIISNSPCRSTSPVISTGSATIWSTCLFTGLPSVETNSR